MRKKDKAKGGIRMAAGLLLMVCMVLVGVLLGGTMKVEATATTTAPTIDITKKGSITIHKYEYSGTGGTATGKPGDSANVPADAKALGNVKFTIYQVKTAAELQAIYQGISAGTMPEPGDYTYANNILKDKEGNTITQHAEGTTANTEDDKKGVVTFTNLPVGIYLVVETDAPENVTTRSAPFLVSIPTTIDNVDDDNNDNDTWLYDVHVFPKNATTYSKKVTLFKEGSDGTKLSGVTFKLQRKTEEKDENGKDIWEDVDTLTTDDPDGKIEVSSLPSGTYRLVETDIGDNAGYIGDYSEAYVFVVKDNGDIERESPGDTYLEVVETEGDDKGTATITVINEKPDVDKKVKDKDGNWKQEADYNVGDTISYRIEIKVPANIADLKKFWVKDTPSGIECDTSTVKVLGSDETTEIGVTGNYKLGISPTDNDAPVGGFIVKFTTTSDTIKQQAGKTIYITYNAVLTEDAVSSTEEVKAGNTNTVDLIFSKYIKPTDEPDSPEPPDDTIEDNAVVYTFQLDIVKDGKTATGTKRLNGVKFDLYKAAADGNVTGDAAKALGLDATEKWKKINNTPLVTTGTGEDGEPLGQVSIGGLANGTYYLVETETITGYNLLSKPIKVELSTTYITGYKNPNNGTGGTEEGTEGGTEEGTGDGAKKIIIKHEIDPTGTTITQTIYLNRDGNGGNSVSTITILNTKGFTLPTTGGAGGFLFAVIGCSVMIVGIILFKKTKKKPENE